MSDGVARCCIVLAALVMFVGSSSLVCVGSDWLFYQGNPPEANIQVQVGFVKNASAKRITHMRVSIGNPFSGPVTIAWDQSSVIVYGYVNQISDINPELQRTTIPPGRTIQAELSFISTRYVDDFEQTDMPFLDLITLGLAVSAVLKKNQVLGRYYSSPIL